MTARNWFCAGVLGLIHLLAAVGNAQEVVERAPEDKDTKPSIAVEDLPRRFDPAKLEDARAAAAAADQLELAFAGKRRPEAVRMLIAILRGSQLGPESGWFGPCQTRYSWKWLAQQCGADAAKGVVRAGFPGSDAWFACLDRNKDGTIAANDLDWSDRNPDVQMAYLANRLFRKLNAAGNGRLTQDELLKFFATAAQGKDHLSADDFRDALMGGVSGGFLPGDAPTRTMLIRGLYEGAIGSMHEGPRLEEPAPNFILKTVAGKETIDLAKLIGPKPVVLVLGNFTCGPFRSFCAGVESVYQRHRKNATLVMIYVREAHPTDGWKMASNARAGVEVKQPTTLAERVAVAARFCATLKPSMPVVVDDVNDQVGHAYSGMPARMYVIDCQGKVAYKSGRGPFGFRVGEMEQALVMALLEQQAAARK